MLPLHHVVDAGTETRAKFVIVLRVLHLADRAHRLQEFLTIYHHFASCTNAFNSRSTLSPSGSGFGSRGNSNVTLLSRAKASAVTGCLLFSIWMKPRTKDIWRSRSSRLHTCVFADFVIPLAIRVPPRRGRKSPPRSRAGIAPASGAR